MLILPLMYKTIIIRRTIIIGLSNCPAISPQRHTSHTQMRIKAKVYVRVQAIWDRTDCPSALVCGRVYVENGETEHRKWNITVPLGFSSSL